MGSETARALRLLRMDLDQRIRTEEQRASKGYDPNWGKGVAQGAA